MDETEGPNAPVVPTEPLALTAPVTAHPVNSPYLVWVNLEGPLVPASEYGSTDGDYCFTKDGWLVLYFALDPKDMVQVMLGGDRRQIYRFPEGAPAFTKLCQLPVIVSRETAEEQASRIIT